MKRRHTEVDVAPSRSRSPHASPKSRSRSPQKSSTSSKPVRFVDDSDLPINMPSKGIPEINKLPVHVIIKIFFKIDSVNQAKLRRVCRHWNDVLQSPSLSTTAYIDLSQLGPSWRLKNPHPKIYNSLFRNYGCHFIRMSTVRLVVHDSAQPKIQQCEESHQGTGAEKERFWTTLWRDVNFSINHMTVILGGIFIEWETLLRCLEHQPIRRIILRDICVLKVPSSGKDVGAPRISLQVESSHVEFQKIKGEADDDTFCNIHKSMISMLERSIKALNDKELEQLNTAICVTWNESDRKIIASIIKGREGIDISDVQAKDLKVITQRELLPFVYRLWPHLKPKIKEPCLFIKGLRQ